MSQIAWRSDIQGLRGVAVLAVVFYHLGIPGFTGGYVGVDIFFVISGYLITGLLIKEVQLNGRVNYAYFFMRRIRRLAPALAGMVVVTCLVCFVVYAPTDQVALAKTAGFASAYLSNFWFSHLATDYLAGNADQNPFLHTWSLGVEEQFYLVWPFVISIIGGCFVKTARVLMGVFVAVLLGSLALCFYQTSIGQTHYSFFLLPARAWEFAVGALCFLITKQFPSGKSKLNSFWRVSLSWFGIGLVGLGVFAFSKETPYPSVFTLLPVLGTGILLCNQRDGTGGLLTGPLMLRIGAISYSLYLWHWPVIVVGHDLFPAGGYLLKAGGFALSYVLAELSFRYVESRYRHNPPRPSVNILEVGRASGVVVVAGLVSVGWWLTTHAVLSVPPQAAFDQASFDMPDTYETRNAQDMRCHVPLTATRLSNCVINPHGTGADVVLIGDSHAAQWTPALKIIAREFGWRLHIYTKSGCNSLPIRAAFNNRLGRRYSECSVWKVKAYNSIEKLHPQLVIISAAIHSQEYSASRWVSGMENLLRKLSPNVGNVVVFGDTPRAPFNVPSCLSSNAWHNLLFDGFGYSASRECNFRIDDPYQTNVLAGWRNASRLIGNAYYLDTRGMVCPSDRCTVFNSAAMRVTYRDSAHLTARFVRSIATPLRTKMETSLPSDLF